MIDPQSDATTAGHDERAAPQRGGRRGTAKPLLAAILAAAIVAGNAVFAWQATTLTPTIHVDGAFQTASGLMRLLAGDVPANDFLPYLGIGPILLLFPAFLLAGGDLAASVFASHAMTLVMFELTFVVLILLVTKRRSLLVGLVGAALPLIGILVISTGESVLMEACAVCVQRVQEASTPGLSLRPVRAAAPFILALVMFLGFTSARSGRVQAVTVGVASGVIAAIWSNDFGLVSGLGGLFAAGLIGLVSFSWQKRNLVYLIAAAVVSGLALGLLTTAGQYLAYLRFNLIDVRGDQFWYFAGWTERNRIFGLNDVISALSDREVLIALVVFVAIGTRTLFTRDLSGWLLSYIGLALFLGGAVATYGGHLGAYFRPFTFWALVTLAFLALSVVLRVRPGVRRTRSAVAAACAVAIVLGCAPLVVSEIRQRDSLTADADFAYNSDLGGYLATEFSPLLDTAVDDADVVIEEYSGLFSALHGSMSGVKVDAVIHALGSERAVFRTAIEAEPALVITTNPEFDPDLDEWVGWSLSANWWFYGELFRGYAPTVSSPTTLSWTPTTPGLWPSVQCEIGTNGQSVLLQTEPNTLYEVSVDYAGPQLGSRSFSMIYNNLNYADDGDGYVPLNPGMTSQAFPVFAMGTGEMTLPLIDIAAPGTPTLTELDGCTAKKIGTRDSDTIALYESILPTGDGPTR